MGFRRNDLQEAFFVPGDHAFRVWGFSTTDCLADVLRPGYFTVGGLLHAGAGVSGAEFRASIEFLGFPSRSGCDSK